MSAERQDDEAGKPARPQAWQPFTPLGVAAFARAGMGRALALLMVMGVLIGLVMAWFVRSAWFPPLGQAVAALPLAGEIVEGRLQVPLAQPQALADNQFLSLAVDLEHTGEQTPPADVQLEFGATNLYVRGVLGYVAVTYPPDYRVPLNQREAVPWWGAWSQAILAGVWVGTTMGLLLIWGVLALGYVPLARVVAWLRGAELGVGAAWSLCAAALMPGALIMTLGIVAYGWGLVDLIRLGLVTLFHVMVAWVYVPLAVCCLPRAAGSAAPQGNPFANKS
ncbi:MAG: hypothetical protein N3J91_08590 [Verrucomicrobiae bacterium]|nr:hypothetical protein [Verrucomicrobiae bacterium]